MKSPEQIGGPPEQPDEEKKITSPEEAAELTQQRRKEYGLEERDDISSEQAEELEKAIDGQLNRLNEYDYESFNPEIQEEWYWVEQEAVVGQDRELAKAVLERFLKLLEIESKNPPA